MSSTTGHLLTTTSQTFTSSASAQIGASVPTRTPVSQAPAANTTKKGDWDLSASKIANELSTLLSDLTYTVTEPVVTSSNPNVSNIATAASNSASNVYVQGGVPVPSASGGSDKADAASALPASTNRTPSDGTASGQAAQHRPSLTSSKGSPAAGQLSQPMPAPTLPNPVLSDHGKVVSAPSVANDQPNTREATAGGGPQTIAGQGGSSAGDKSSSSTVIFNGSSGSGGGFSPTGYKLGDVPPKEESANTGSAITGGGVGGSGDGNSSSMPTKGQGSSSNDAKPNTSPSNVSTQDGLIIPQIERPKASTTQGEHAGGTNRDGDINGSITKSQTEAGGGKGSSGSTAQGGQADGSRKNGSAQQGNNLAPNTSDTAASLPIPTKDQESSLNHAKPKTSPSNMSTQDGLILPQTERPKASTPQGENAGGTSRESADNVSITKTQTEAGAGKGSSGRTAQTGHADESAKNGSAQQGNNLAPNTSDTAVHPPNMSTPDGLILPEIGNPNDVATTRTKAGATSGKSSIGKGQDDAKNGVEGSGSTPGNGNIDQAGQGRSAQQEIDLAPLLPDSAIGQQASSSTGAAEDDVVKESASPDDAAGLVTDEPGADDSEDGAVETEIVDEEGATEEGALDSKPSASTSDASRLGAVELRPDASQTPDKADASVQLSPTADEPELLGDDPNLDQPLAEVDLQPVEPEVNDTGVIAEPEEEPEEIDLADPETAPAVPDIEDTAPTADVTEPSADSDATLSAGLESASDTTPPEAELQNTSEVDLLSGDEAATADSDAAVDGPELEGADADAAAEGGVEDGAGDSSELPAEVTEPPESPDASGGDDEVAASPLEEDESSESPDSVNETPAAPPPASVPLLFVPGGYTHDDAVTICSLAAVTVSIANCGVLCEIL